jgi:hypothetical protein
MRTDSTSTRLIALLTFAIIGGLLAGCAAKQEAAVTAEKPAAPAEPKEGVLLVYRMPADSALRYGTTIEQTHEMDLMGRIQNSALHKSTECTISPGGPDTPDLDLEVQIDSYHVRIDAPRGTIGGDIRQLIGKKFFMALSKTGEESGYKLTQEVSFELQPAGEINAAHDFEDFFPDFPDKPLKAGDSWKGADRITDTAFMSEKKIILEVDYRLDGFETAGGMECAKISGKIKGRLEGGSPESAHTPEINASYNGIGHWLFAIEEGLLVKRNVTLQGSGQMATGGGHGPPARLSQRTTVATQLLK